MSPTRRDTRVATYTSEEDRDQWEKEADRADKSLSQYVYDRVQESRDADTMDQTIREVSAEERLEQIVQENRDSLLSIASEIDARNGDMADMVAIGACYPIVNFRILKRLFGDSGDLPEQWISDQFSEASRKLRGDVSPADNRSTPGTAGTDDLYGGSD